MKSKEMCVGILNRPGTWGEKIKINQIYTLHPEDDSGIRNQESCNCFNPQSSKDIPPLKCICGLQNL